MLWTRWLVLLLCWGATSGEQQAEERRAAPADVRTDSRRERSPPPVEPLDFGFVPSAVYDTHAYYEPGAIGILFHMVHAFLYVVQPNSFPKGENPPQPHPNTHTVPLHPFPPILFALNVTYYFSTAYGFTFCCGYRSI